MPKPPPASPRSLRVELVEPQFLKHAREELFHDGRYVAVSRSGLHPCERRLVAAYGTVKGRIKRVLIVGNRTGFCGVVAADWFGADVVQHAFDKHHADVIDRTIRHARQRRASVSCRAYLPDEIFDLVLVQLSKGGLPAELATDCLQQIRDRLKPGGTCLVSCEEGDGALSEQLKEMLGKATVQSRHGKAGLITAVRSNPDERKREFAAHFDMTLPEGPTVKLMTLPGVFSHRRVDEGAQALAEVAEVPVGGRLLDIGCGCGAVGIALSLKYDLKATCFIDSHARATYTTSVNCRSNGLRDTTILLDDRGHVSQREFDVVVGNPPYYSNHRIAELFIEMAHRALKVDGRVFMVAKSTDRLSETMFSLFGNAETVTRRGYGVVCSRKTSSQFRRIPRPRADNDGTERRRSRPGRTRR